jgi:hypothetical protein
MEANASADIAGFGAVYDPCGRTEGHEQSLFQYLGEGGLARSSAAALENVPAQTRPRRLPTCPALLSNGAFETRRGPYFRVFC